MENEEVTKNLNPLGNDVKCQFKVGGPNVIFSLSARALRKVEVRYDLIIRTNIRRYLIIRF